MVLGFWVNQGGRLSQQWSNNPVIKIGYLILNAFYISNYQ